MADAMLNAAIKGIEFVSPDEVDDFADLEQLNTIMQGDEFVAKVKVDNKGIEEEYNILFRHPTPSEISIIDGSLLSQKVLEKLVNQDPNNKKLNAQLNKQATKELADKQFLKMVKILALCAKKPAGITEEMVERWDSESIDSIFVKLMGQGAKPTKVDTFPELGK